LSNPDDTPSSPARTTSSSVSSPAWIWFRLGVVLLVVAAVVARWDKTTGITGLIRFGRDFEGTRLPQVQPLPLAIVPGSGYDGQFYAQIAVAPEVTAPALKTALDQPAYRARRIFLPLLAHALGFGRPWWVLQAYALLNLAAWLALAWLWWRQLDAPNARGMAVWLACLLSLGALDSVRLALTDLPMVLALTLAVSALQRRRFGLAALGFIIAGFIRETAVIAVQPLGLTDNAQDRRSAWFKAALCVVPVALWCGWLVYVLPSSSHGVQGNLDWPGLAFFRHVGTCLQALCQGDFDSRTSFGLIGALGLGYQSLYLLGHARESDPWVRIGLSFAFLFWFLGDYVWHGYWAAARTCLPMTFAFNYRLLKEHRFALRFSIGNLFALHGLIRFLPF
jgi:hypothetical protein